MKDCEMWLVFDDGTESFEMIRLDDISRIKSGYDYLEIHLVGDKSEWGYHTFDSSADQGIAYKGTFLQCLSYVENKENYK